MYNKNKLSKTAFNQYMERTEEQCKYCTQWLAEREDDSTDPCHECQVGHIGDEYSYSVRLDELTRTRKIP